MAVCGTYGGYQRHKRRGEEACGPCLAANRDYQRDLRERRPEVYADERMRSAARSRALWRLAREHPDRFLQLAVEELSKVTFPEEAA